MRFEKVANQKGIDATLELLERFKEIYALNGKSAIFPSMSEIERQTGASTRAVRDAFNEMEMNGAMERCNPGKDEAGNRTAPFRFTDQAEAGIDEAIMLMKRRKRNNGGPRSNWMIGTSITLPEDDFKRLKEIGDGNMSAGVRKLIKEHKKEKEIA